MQYHHNFQHLERLAPLGYFAMGIGWIQLSGGDRMLAIANGSDWTPQPLTLHAPRAESGFEKLPSWFSNDYDHHMGLAVGDLTGNGYDDIVVAVFSGKNQSLREGGVKAYLGGPNGLNPDPIWIARGFAATGVALAPFSGKRTADVIVSCLSEDGTIQSPALDDQGRFPGRPRLLENKTPQGSEVPIFQEHIIEREIVRGAGDVTAADVDFDGNLDVVFAGSRTSVLYGDPQPERGSPWRDAECWQSSEEHPFSFSALAFRHPAFPEQQLIASSRGLMSASQLKGRSLEDIGTGILIHAPKRGRETRALQHLGKLQAEKPSIPAGLAIAHDCSGRPSLIAGFLDARGRDIRGVPLRAFRSSPTDTTAPFTSEEGEELPGGGLMAARLAVAPRTDGPSRVSQHSFVVSGGPWHVLTLPWCPAGAPLFVKASDSNDRPVDVSFSLSADGTALYFSPKLSTGTRVTVVARTTDDVEIAATSSAAWPPAGASGVWRGRLARRKTKTPENSPPSASAREAG